MSYITPHPGSGGMRRGGAFDEVLHASAAEVKDLPDHQFGARRGRPGPRRLPVTAPRFGSRRLPAWREQQTRRKRSGS
jgi:hypothetical protein